MVTTKETRLRIREESGDLIRYPALMFFAATTSPNIWDIEAAYHFMKSEQSVPLDISNDEQPSKTRLNFEKGILGADFQNRQFAGMVGLVIHDANVEREETPSLNEAYRLVAQIVSEKHPKPRSVPLANTVKKAFRKYRSVAHYLAVLVSMPDQLEEAERDVSKIDMMFEIALYFQVLFEKQYDTSQWGLIKLPADYKDPYIPRFG